jgi:hypothetical protein
MKTYKGFKIGDRVTVKITENAYDRETLTPDMIGTIKAFSPKVHLCQLSEINDRLPYFAYVEFDKTFNPPHNNHIRGGINIKNLKKV